MQLHTDVPTTRRKRLHHLTTDQGKLLWSGNRVVDALDHAFDSGHDVIELIGHSQGYQHKFVIKITAYSSTAIEQSDIEDITEDAF